MAVDRCISKKFSLFFRSSDSEAHKYSADEIVIVFEFFRSGIDMRFAELQESAPSQGLSFKFEIGEWVVCKESIRDIDHALYTAITTQKKINC